MYFMERFIIGFVWLLSIVSIGLIPKQKYREASFIFFFTQLPAWILGLLVVEANLIEYPVRALHKANATSFTFEYLVLPIICIFFNLYYPENKGLYKKILFYTTTMGIFTYVEYLAESYTLILTYIHWEWYTTFITMSIFIYFVRSIYKWFFKLGKPFLL